MSKTTTLTLGIAITEDGCTARDTGAFLSLASLLRGVVKRQHGKFTGFRVKVDGEWTTLKSLDSLDKFLQDINWGGVAKVFRNADQGVTIDFDRY
jgi:hypothetical protein